MRASILANAEIKLSPKSIDAPSKLVVVKVEAATGISFFLGQMAKRLGTSDEGPTRVFEKTT